MVQPLLCFLGFWKQKTAIFVPLMDDGKGRLAGSDSQVGGNKTHLRHKP